MAQGRSQPCAEGQFSGPALGGSTPVNPPVTITTDPAILYPKNRDVYLGHDDTIAVRLYGSADYASTVRIGLDGLIQLPLIGSIAVEGLTVRRTQDLIAEKLVAAGMYRDPQVSVQIVESPEPVCNDCWRAAWSGSDHWGETAIRRTGGWAVGGGGGGSATGTTVVVGGGGLPTTASHIITINRPGVAEPIVVDMGTDPATVSAQADIPIFPRDTIVVSRVGVVYILRSIQDSGRDTASTELADDADEGGGAGRRYGL